MEPIVLADTHFHGLQKEKEKERAESGSCQEISFQVAGSKSNDV